MKISEINIYNTFYFILSSADPTHNYECGCTDTIKHQRSLLRFNGTFNKTDISSSQQQCLDRKRVGEWGSGEGSLRFVADGEKLHTVNLCFLSISSHRCNV